MSANLAFRTMGTNMYKCFVVRIYIRRLFPSCNDELFQCITLIWPQYPIASAWPVPDFGILRTRFHNEIPVGKIWCLHAWQETNVVTNCTSPLPLSYDSTNLCGGAYARCSRFVYHFAPNAPTESCRCTNRIPWYHQNPLHTQRILSCISKCSVGS